ncbi:MAG: YdcF family protein [Solobacterium sp.]|nr:YdcF family protein [Solobacterium sp.]
MDKSFWTAAGILSEFYGVLICILEANFRAYRMIWLVSGIIFTAYGLLPFPFLKWAAAFAAFILAVLFLLCILLHINNEKIALKGRKSDPEILLIPGCKTGSLALIRRCEAAADFYRTHPDILIIGTGGQGADEEMPEGTAIRDLLVKNGVTKDHIRCETESVSTRENILFSDRKFQIREKRTAVVTSHYHLTRSLMIAKQCGVMHCDGIPAKINPIFMPDYLLREVLAMIKTLLVHWAEKQKKRL